MLLDQVKLDIETWERAGTHRTATQGDKATDRWLREEIARCGQAPLTINYEFERLDIEACRVEIGELEIPAVPMFDAVPGRAEGVLGDQIELVQYHATDQHPATLAFKRARHASTCAAMIAVGVEPSPRFALLNAEGYRERSNPPVVQVAGEHWAALKQAQAQGAKAKVVCDAQFTPTFATNIECRIDGRDAGAAPLIVMTPKSSWWTSTAERIGGIAIWLHLLRLFADQAPRRGLIFTANSGHELSHLGLDHFLAANTDRLSDAHLWLHLGANFAARDSGVRIQASTPHLMERLSGALADQALKFSATPVAERPAGEARNIYDLQGDFISLLGSNPWFHQDDDHGARVLDLAKLQSICHGITELIQSVADA